MFLNHKGICGEREEARTSHPLHSYDFSVVQPTKQESLGICRGNMPEKKKKKDWEKLWEKKKQFQLHHVPSIKAQQ